MPYSYACTEFPGMEGCPGHFVAATAEEVLELTKLHARIAHGEDPDSWPTEDLRQVQGLIRPT
jgi:predicted small metal-binding protein